MLGVYMKRLLLHTCCAPCASGCIPQLDEYNITLFFYNPNIDTLEEYNRRLETLRSFVDQYNLEFKRDLKLIAVPYNYSEFKNKIINLENEPEGGKRCSVCFGIRLDKTFEYAQDKSYDIVASTLSISPHKDFELINQIGKNLSQKYNIEYLPSNFKKKNGFLLSIQNSKKYNLYRQNYCGCNLPNVN